MHGGSNLVTWDTLVEFPTHLKEVDEMAKRLRDAIHTHQVGSSNAIINLSIPPIFTTLRYNKMKAYGNHFLIDND